MITIPARCPNCGEYYPHFTWAHSLQGKSGIVDGRHCMNEIQVSIVLGCDECSETLVVMPIEEFLTEVGHTNIVLMRDTPVSQEPETGHLSAEARQALGWS